MIKVEYLLKIALQISLSMVGAALFAAGCYRIGNGALHSAIFHAFMGLVLLLLYSENARILLLRSLPRTLLIYLYQKSVIDILIEPSPLAKAYTLVALSGVLGNEDLRRLMDTLPRECDYLRRPGLIHMLPNMLQNMFNSPTLLEDLELEQAEILTQEGIVGEVTEAEPNDFFITPRVFHRDDSLAAGGDDDNDAEPGTTTMPVATHIVTAAASSISSRSPSHSPPTEFEQMLSEISALRIRALTSQAYELFSGHALALTNEIGRFLITGGTASDAQLTVACISCSSAALVINFVNNDRWRQPHAIVRRTMDSASATAAGAAALISIMMAARAAMQLDAGTGEVAVLSRGINVQSGRSGALISAMRRVWTTACSRVESACRYSPMNSSVVALSVVLTALFAWKLRTRWRRLRWLVLVLQSRIQESTQQFMERLFQ